MNYMNFEYLDKDFDQKFDSIDELYSETKNLYNKIKKNKANNLNKIYEGLSFK